MIERFISNIITGHYICTFFFLFFLYFVQSFTQVKNDIILLAPISSFGFSVDSCAPWKKTLPLWRTRVGYVRALFIPHAVYNYEAKIIVIPNTGGCPTISKVWSGSPLNSDDQQSR